MEDAYRVAEEQPRMVQSMSQPAGAAPSAYAGVRVEPDDAELIAAAKRDPRAFAAVYERYVDPVYRYCFVQLGSRAAAEDVTSEVFLKALGGLGGFRGGAVAAWILRIARNAVTDTYRRRRPVSTLAAADDIADPGLSPEATAVERARRRALREALVALPDDQRTAIELQLAGWSGEQSAAAMGKSAAAVYMLRARALERMQRSLRGTGWLPGEDSNAQA